MGRGGGVHAAADCAVGLEAVGGEGRGVQGEATTDGEASTSRVDVQPATLTTVLQIETDHLQVITSTQLATRYVVHLALSTTSNNGKSLIHKSRVVVARGVGELVDEAGGVEEGEVKRWLAGVLREAGVVGVDDGLKDE